MAVASLADQVTVAADTTFQNRVRQAIIAAAIAIKNEGENVVSHKERVTLSKNVMNSPSTYAPLFAMAVAGDSAIGTDVGTGPPVPNNATDAHINAAISSMWNSFFSVYG